MWSRGPVVLQDAQMIPHADRASPCPKSDTSLGQELRMVVAMTATTSSCPMIGTWGAKLRSRQMKRQMQSPKKKTSQESQGDQEQKKAQERMFGAQRNSVPMLLLLKLFGGIYNFCQVIVVLTTEIFKFCATFIIWVKRKIDCGYVVLISI